MRHRFAVLSFLIIAVASLSSTTASAAVDLPAYAALRAAKPDGRTIALNGFTFEKDVYSVRLDGTLHLLAAVDGKNPGGVFLGKGTWTLTPASEREAQTIALNVGDGDGKRISDEFERAIFLGGALVTAAAAQAAPQSGTPDRAALDAWDDYMKQQRRDLHTNLHVRLLQEIVDGGDPLFFCWVDGKSLPPAALIVDPLGAEAVRLAGSDLGGEQSMLYVNEQRKGGIWYSSRFREEIQKGVGVVIAPRAEAEHYAVDSSIKGADLSGTTTMTFIPGAELRVLPIDLSPRLRISEVAYATAADPATWTPVAFIQEELKEDADAAVVFPSPLKKGEKYLLRTTYAGENILEDAGDGNFTVTRRTNWYPNVGVFSDMATYDLNFTTPEKFEIIGVGRQVENKVEGGRRTSVWKAERPVRVAGFNYGRFKKLSETDKDSGMTFEVYTNPGTPDIIRQINQVLSGGGDMPGEIGMGPTVKVNAGSLAKSALADGINTARTANHFFGPLQENRVAVTQQSQWFFGQSWPTLIYMPYVAFLNGYQRMLLGLNDTKDFVDNVGAHELAHQWWGHQVGTRTYHDEWISEGFSEFTASLVAQQTGGWAKYFDFYERARKSLLEKPRGATIVTNDAGPITQGWRVSSWQNPGAYGVVVYSKGAWVLHMIRMAMYDRAKGDEAFIAMMKEFASTFSGKDASTGDFQRIVEKHAPASMKLTKDGKLDWFFGQWVHGTAIPKIDANFTVTEAGGGKYKVSGTIAQSQVPANFATVVPIYAFFDKGAFAKLGATAVIGTSSKPIEFELALPKKPEKIGINAMSDVLTR